MKNQNEKIVIPIDNLQRLSNILNSIRVSMDRIGGLDDTAKQQRALSEYFGPTVYREVRDCTAITDELLDKAIGHDASVAAYKKCNVPPYGS